MGKNYPDPRTKPVEEPHQVMAAAHPVEKTEKQRNLEDYESYPYTKDACL